MAYTITFDEHASDEDLKLLSDGLEAHARAVLPEKSFTNVHFFLRDDNGKIAGGVSGNWGSFGWLYVNILWVRDDLRGHGYGKQLMDLIEAEAIKHGCKNAFLNTMSYQAPNFYKKLGYTVFAELENFPDEHSRLMMRKKLG